MARFHLVFLLLAIIVTFSSYRFYLRKNVVKDHSENLRSRLEIMSSHLEADKNKDCKEIKLLEKQNIYYINRSGEILCPTQFKLSQATKDQIKKTDLHYVIFKSSVIEDNFIAFRKVKVQTI